MRSPKSPGDGNDRENEFAPGAKAALYSEAEFHV